MSAQHTAVITGASAGVGKAAARQLLDLGWRVIGVGRDAGRCAKAEAELASPAFIMLRADLSLMREVARLADDILALTPRIDALLNNAGGVVAPTAAAVTAAALPALASAPAPVTIPVPDADIADAVAGKCAAGFSLVAKDQKCHKICGLGQCRPATRFCTPCNGTNICSVALDFCK